jgi:NAD-reducing hydrogenase small subunit
MSLLDMDDRLLELAGKMDLVYSPIVDNKEFPDNVDITLVEGAVGNEEDFHRIRKAREKSRILVSLGDCAVTANVPSMRNPFGAKSVLQRAYVDNVTLQPGAPQEDVPALLPSSRPLHEVVTIDVFVPGCPPSADVIYYVLSELLEGRTPSLSDKSRFGA